MGRPLTEARDIERHRTTMGTIEISLGLVRRRRLWVEASRRNMTMKTYARALLVAIIDDDLFRAVLDK